VATTPLDRSNHPDTAATKVCHNNKTSIIVDLKMEVGIQSAEARKSVMAHKITSFKNQPQLSETMMGQYWLTNTRQ